MSNVFAHSDASWWYCWPFLACRGVVCIVFGLSLFDTQRNARRRRQTHSHQNRHCGLPKTREAILELIQSWGFLVRTVKFNWIPCMIPWNVHLFYFFYCICFPLSNDNAHRSGFGHLMIWLAFIYSHRPGRRLHGTRIHKWANDKSNALLLPIAIQTTFRHQCASGCQPRCERRIYNIIYILVAWRAHVVTYRFTHYYGFFLVRFDFPSTSFKHWHTLGQMVMTLPMGVFVLMNFHTANRPESRTI